MPTLVRAVRVLALAALFAAPASASAATLFRAKHPPVVVVVGQTVRVSGTVGATEGSGLDAIADRPVADDSYRRRRRGRGDDAAEGRGASHARRAHLRRDRAEHAHRRGAAHRLPQGRQDEGTVRGPRQDRDQRHGRERRPDRGRAGGQADLELARRSPARDQHARWRTTGRLSRAQGLPRRQRGARVPVAVVARRRCRPAVHRAVLPAAGHRGQRLGEAAEQARRDDGSSRGSVRHPREVRRARLDARAGCRREGPLPLRRDRETDRAGRPDDRDDEHHLPDLGPVSASRCPTAA